QESLTHDSDCGRLRAILGQVKREAPPTGPAGFATKAATGLPDAAARRPCRIFAMIRFKICRH
ncbi:MAG: hypothetical protein B7Y02_08155, partial [Rhodobacterales bacterium 17-64-5]